MNVSLPKAPRHIISHTLMVLAIALFTKTMLNDHLPSHYERSTQLLFDGMGQGKI